MVAHNFLSDTEVADVITYVRSNFGNDAPAVTAEEVAAIRGAQ
jgi:mono/diheme cytochrome c family protein